MLTTKERMMMAQRCLIISDDLTGGADTGVQFSKRGLETILLITKDLNLDISAYSHSDVLIVNTSSRGMPPEQAFSSVSKIFNTYGKNLFPILYKKIDSTLRGNIGCEIDAILKQTDISTAFIAPSYPQQNRTVSDGILMVSGVPVASTEMAHDAVSPIKESHVHRLIQQQTSHPVGWIDLARVSAGIEGLKKAVLQEQEKGNRLIVFDAVRNDDLAHIAQVAFSMDNLPLLIGSAGLADEVARISSSVKESVPSSPSQLKRRFEHVFIISGSASSVTHDQLMRVEKTRGIASFELNRRFFTDDALIRQEGRTDLCSRIVSALKRGHAILKASPERFPLEVQGSPAHLEITDFLSSIASNVLNELARTLNLNDLVLILTGGETAMSVLNGLGVAGIRIESEILGGIVMSRVLDGNMTGMTIITKAGAFGKEDSLEEILKALESSEE